MKKTASALTLIFTLLFSPLIIVKAAQFNYEQFEGLPYTPPTITILSPLQNGLYTVPDIPLNVTVQIRSIIYPGNLERIRWLNYSLDGQPLTPMANFLPSYLTPPYYVHGNDVLTGLSCGNHNLTIFGETFIGGLNGYFNETVTFTIDTASTSKLESFVLSLIIASLITLAVEGIGVIIHFKKHKH